MSEPGPTTEAHFGSFMPVHISTFNFNITFINELTLAAVSVKGSALEPAASTYTAAESCSPSQLRLTKATCRRPDYLDKSHNLRQEVTSTVTKSQSTRESSSTNTETVDQGLHIADTYIQRSTRGRRG